MNILHFGNHKLTEHSGVWSIFW